MPRVTLDGVRVRAARGEAPAIGRWAAVAHAFVAIALALPVMVAAVILAWGFVDPGQTVANRWLLALLGAAFAAVVGWAAMLPQVRSLEVSAARTLLGAALPDVPDPRSWGSRRRGALWLLTLVVTGLVLTVALLYLVPLGVGLLAHPLTGQPELRWPGGGDPMAVGTGWRAWWLVVPGVLALAGAVGAVLGAGLLLRRWAPRMLGPTLLERVAAAAERERELARRNELAREVHDGVGHALTAMTLQVSAARATLRRDPDAADSFLAAAEDVGRRAQADVDAVVGALRAGDERPGGFGARDSPPPVTVGPGRAHLGEPPEDAGAGVDVVPRVRALAGQASARADLPAELVLPTAVAHTVFRVVQESLTNASRHGRSVARVCLRAAPGAPGVPGVEVEVRNDLLDSRGERCDDAASSPRSPHGLVGLRERVLLHGGRLEAGPRGAEWVVTVVVPGEP